MSITLNLGVVDVPYAKGQSTGKVAEILEKNYGVMEFFAYKYQNDIAKAIETDLVDFIEDALSGKSLQANPLAISCSKIETLFKDALAMRFMDGSNFSNRPIPTAASLGGISKRFKDKRNKQRKRGVRPSFVDTGLYRQSFKAWVDL